MINALVERFRLEREMTKAGVIKGSVVFDVVYPSIGIGLVCGAYHWLYLIVAFFISLPIFFLIDCFVIKPNLLWREGTVVVVLIGLFWYSFRRIITMRTWFLVVMLTAFVFMAVVTVVFFFQNDLWLYRAYKDVYLRQKEAN